MRKPIQKRTPTSKTLRFNVFKRDNFKCIYCGKSPPEVILEADHIIPVKRGGLTEINNMATSCFDCNRGKGSKSLKTIPNSMLQTLEVMKEKEAQLKEYYKFINRIEKRLQRDIEEINNIYAKHYEGWVFSEKFKRATLKNFLNKLPKQAIIDSLYIAISKFPDDEDNVISYFCGICWNKIKNKEF